MLNGTADRVAVCVGAESLDVAVSHATRCQFKLSRYAPAVYLLFAIIFLEFVAVTSPLEFCYTTDVVARHHAIVWGHGVERCPQIIYKLQRLWKDFDSYGTVPH